MAPWRQPFGNFTYCANVARETNGQSFYAALNLFTNVIKTAKINQERKLTDSKNYFQKTSSKLSSSKTAWNHHDTMETALNILLELKNMKCK